MEALMNHQHETPKYLLLIDINGILCHKTGVEVPGIEADLLLRNQLIYHRPGVSAFIRTLKEMNAFKIRIFSSIMSQDARAIVEALLPNHPDLQDSILHRSSITCSEGNRDWGSKADLQKIWPFIKLGNFRPFNTMILYTKYNKLGNLAVNGVYVPPFEREDVMVRKNHTIDGLLAYLVNIAKEKPSDIRPYLIQYPFDRKQWGTTAQQLLDPKFRGGPSRRLGHNAGIYSRALRQPYLFFHDDDAEDGNVSDDSDDADYDDSLEKDGTFYGGGGLRIEQGVRHSEESEEDSDSESDSYESSDNSDDSDNIDKQKVLHQDLENELRKLEEENDGNMDAKLLSLIQRITGFGIKEQAGQKRFRNRKDSPFPHEKGSGIGSSSMRKSEDDGS